MKQVYNAQATVDANSQVICGARIAESTGMGELAANVESSEAPVQVVLAGYASGEDVAAVEAQGVEALVAVGGANRRKYDFRPEMEKKPVKNETDWKRVMRERTEKNEELYKLRMQSVEPTFGIIKSAMGRFRLRGCVGAKWLLIAAAYNLRRLRNLLVPAPG